MKRRNFIQLSSVAVVGAVSVPALAWKSDAKLRIIWGGGVRWEDIQKRLTSGCWKNAETGISDVTGNHGTDFLAKLQKRGFGQLVWMNGNPVSSEEFQHPGGFACNIAGNSLENDLASLKIAFASRTSAIVYLHATDVAHYDREQYEKCIDQIIAYIEEHATEPFRMESTMGRNQVNTEYGTVLKDTENAHHNPTDLGTRTLFIVEFEPPA